jgi:hypothetical protein
MRILFKLIRRLVLPAILVISLLFNGLLLVSAAVFDFASSVVSSVTGDKLPRARHSDDIARLTANLDEQKRINRELRSETTELSSEVASARVARQRNRETVQKVSRRVATRTTKAATRETAAMAGEAIPVWGTAVIVTATALEIKDFCETMKDMNELQAYFDPSLAVPEEDLAVCGMKVPSRSELWEMTRTAPENAWSSAVEAMPSIDGMTEFELPDIAWTEIGSSVGVKARDISNSAAEAVGRKRDQITNWWSE